MNRLAVLGTFVSLSTEAGSMFTVQMGDIFVQKLKVFFSRLVLIAASPGTSFIAANILCINTTRRSCTSVVNQEEQQDVRNKGSRKKIRVFVESAF